MDLLPCIVGPFSIFLDFVSRPSQSVPGGFLLVFFGALLLIYSCLSTYAGWLAHAKPLAERLPNHPDPWPLVAGAVASFIVGMLLTWFGLRMALCTPAYDTRDPDEPSVKS